MILKAVGLLVIVKLVEKFSTPVVAPTAASKWRSRLNDVLSTADDWNPLRFIAMIPSDNRENFPTTKCLSPLDLCSCVGHWQYYRLLV